MSACVREEGVRHVCMYRRDLFLYTTVQLMYH